MSGDDRGFPPGDLRVSDAERDRAVAELSKAFQVGRITADEFDERSGQALRARTGRELIALLADLPAEDLPPEDLPAVPAVAPAPAGRGLPVRGVMTASAIAATVLTLGAIANALGPPGPTIQQQELMRAFAAQHGMPIPPFTPPGSVDWAASLVPAGIALLLVALIVVLHVTRARRQPPSGDNPA
jgi:hypothetical protein